MFDTADLMKAITTIQTVTPPFLGEAFWEPGGDVIHYSDANNRSDVPLRFLVTMVCAPGQPMLVVVDEEELEQRRDRRVPRP